METDALYEIGRDALSGAGSPFDILGWDLERFDRVVIARGQRFGFTTQAATSPQQSNWNTRYRVKLMGDHEVIVNSYGSYEDARKLSLVLAYLTGFPLHEVKAGGL